MKITAENFSIYFQINGIYQILVYTIDGNVVFVHSQYNCILTSQVSIQFMYPSKIVIVVVI